jgi:hypothetical protein
VSSTDGTRADPGTGPDEQVLERLWPGAWFWLLGAGGAVSLGVAYGAALEPAIGWFVAAVAALGVVVLGVRWAARVAVGPAGLRAGRAVLPWSAIGRVLAVDGEHARLARGPQGDASAWMVLRPGVGPGAVVVEVTDPEDPHHTWLVASRDATALASAITQARGRLSP